MNFRQMIDDQRNYFSTGITKSYAFRLEALKKLKKAIIENEQLLAAAMKADLNKSPSESYFCETGIVLDEIGVHIKKLKKWMKNERVTPSLAQFPGSCFRSPEPYGVVLIMAPWNYPINLCFEPVIGAISAGNTMVVKPSNYAPETSHVIAKILGETFPAQYVCVVEGGRQQNSALLEQRFDYIFFTGSPAVGKIVMESAAKNLTPVTLELGGKSPVIVDETANIPLAARRIAFGKVLNAGQTCVEPDYLLIHSSVKDAFVKAFAEALEKFFPKGDYASMVTIITQKHYERIKGLMEGEKILLGGRYEDERRFIEPTLIDGVTLDSPIMKEEIFGPLLPMMTFDHLEEGINVIHSMEKPLALYLFSTNKENQQKILDSCSFGGGCINDVIMHFVNPKLPFGGVGHSGMGSYHGKKSFETFSHYRSVFKQSSKIDLPIRYMPYTRKKDALIRKVFK
ncbi:MAG: aldehyde dehydrogenase [Clostridiales bacterium]|nr:aldehyde dehydrogenase [Clostridiales bacterium]